MSTETRSVLPHLTTAAVELLRAHAGVAAFVDARVHTQVPSKAPTPFLAVMGGRESKMPTFGHHGVLAEILVSMDSTYTGTTEIDAGISEVMNALDGKRVLLPAPWTAAGLEWVENQRPVIVADDTEVYWERTATFLARCK